MSPQPFAELICAYLDGIPGAAAVLNDALEDSGRERLVVDGNASERLALVLEHLLVQPLARRVAIDFAKHVIGYCDSPFAQALLKQKQVEIDPAARPEDLRQAEEEVLAFEEDRYLFQHTILPRLGWTEEPSPKSSAAWSLWGALQIPVRYVSQAAQRASSQELQWQITYLKQLLSE